MIQRNFTLRKNIAFTLAEILITLGIIGVVAALTIPILVNNYQKAQYVTALKKTYSTWNQVLIKIASDNGCVGDLACTGFFDSALSAQEFGDALVKYFNVSKNCGLQTGCFTDKTFPYYDGSGFPTDFNSDPYYRFILTDGSSYAVYSMGNNCENQFAAEATSYSKKTCGFMLVDVNGPTKGPNSMGRDIFSFYLTTNKGPALYPDGGSQHNKIGGSWTDETGVPKECIDTFKTGEFCTGRIMEEGWQMNY